MDTCICMAESLHCLTETIATLLIGYAPIQNKKLKRKKKDYMTKILALTFNGILTKQDFFIFSIVK